MSPWNRTPWRCLSYTYDNVFHYASLPARVWSMPSVRNLQARFLNLLIVKPCEERLHYCASLDTKSSRRRCSAFITFEVIRDTQVVKLKFCKRFWARLSSSALLGLRVCVPCSQLQTGSGYPDTFALCTTVTSRRKPKSGSLVLIKGSTFLSSSILWH